MPPQDQPVIGPFGLMIFQRRQRREGRRFRLMQNRFGHRLQGAPTRPVQLRRVRDLSEQAAPFDDDSVNVTRAEQFRHPAMFVERVLVD